MRTTSIRTLTTMAAALTIASAALLSVAAPAHAAAPPRLESLVDAAVADFLEDDRIPGAAVTVVAGGRTVLAKGYGVADVRTRTPVDPQRTGFFLGSLAKLFTAQAASQLVAEGKVDPKADVNDHLRAVTVPDTYPGRPVTLDQLLTHTGGFDSDLVGRNRTRAKDVEPLAESLVTRRPPRVRAPGTTAAYDNYGYALTGQLVADVSGRSFPAYVDEHILGPLGMTGSTFAQPPPASIAAGLARGYRPNGTSGWTEDEGQYGAWSPSGPGAVSTAVDMGRWMTGQLTDDTTANGLMQRVHYRQDPRMPGLGYGFEEWRRGGRTGWFKDGDIPGFHSNLLLVPARDVGVFVVFNGDGRDGRASWDGKDLIDRIVDVLVPDNPAPAAPGAVTDPSLASYPGTYRPGRVSRTGLMALEGLVASVTVREDGENGLRTTGLSLDPDQPEQRWLALGDGLFQERGGSATLAFTRGGVLVSSAVPSSTYAKLTWHQSPSLHLGLLAAGTGTLILAAIALPVIALVRRLRGRTPHPPAARVARATASATGLIAAAFTAALAAVVRDGNAMMEAVLLGPPLLSIVTMLGTALVLLALGVVAGAIAAWFRGWWNVSGRILFTLTAMAAVAMASMLLQYRLVGGPFV
ncbi:MULTISPECIES: serine hydrolase [Streptomyces]|uniref:Beta-lactamase family protein n=1 Tax=Streptomyces koelreuteriae TaxID=2838015 RepID=A0ABX8G232_9ACTN|nr:MULTISPECIES: serine hydrolase domain-containing protein [Streptomyces]QWB27227.1 beta-lactamase family protein [Streptomyces koelreuteriae]UUA10311.1 beta-lactamase family protein [Streptomyces koelreuteriae]UUA17918.1 beta-lactamase family protein [Streptomyces sp. CRCS-T-1]